MTAREALTQSANSKNSNTINKLLATLYTLQRGRKRPGRGRKRGALLLCVKDIRPSSDSAESFESSSGRVTDCGVRQPVANSPHRICARPRTVTKNKYDMSNAEL
jgi:hypothetical protein